MKTLLVILGLGALVGISMIGAMMAAILWIKKELKRLREEVQEELQFYPDNDAMMQWGRSKFAPLPAVGEYALKGDIPPPPDLEKERRAIKVLLTFVRLLEEKETNFWQTLQQPALEARRQIMAGAGIDQARVREATRAVEQALKAYEALKAESWPEHPANDRLHQLAGLRPDQVDLESASYFEAMGRAHAQYMRSRAEYASKLKQAHAQLRTSRLAREAAESDLQTAKSGTAYLAVQKELARVDAQVELIEKLQVGLNAARKDFKVASSSPLPSPKLPPRPQPPPKVTYPLPPRPPEKRRDSPLPPPPSPKGNTMRPPQGSAPPPPVPAPPRHTQAGPPALSGSATATRVHNEGRFCPYCSAEHEPGATRCPRCKKPINVSSPPTPSQGIPLSEEDGPQSCQEVGESDLIATCESCGAPLPKEAAVCPGCGYPVPGKGIPPMRGLS